MKRPVALAAVTVALLGFVGPASAQVDLERAFFTVGDHGIVAVPGSLRIVGGHVDAVPVTSEDPTIPDAIPDDDFAWLRLRVTPTLTFTGNSWKGFQLYQLGLDADVTTEAFSSGLGSPLTYDPVQEDRSTTPDPRLMQAWFLAAGKRAAIKAGLVRSSWGAGILANDGEDGDAGVARSPFGFSRTADRVVRLQVAFFPIDPKARPDETGPPQPPLTLALAADGVVDDDTADWSEGDRAYNFIAAVRGQVGRFEGGLYAVHRTQEHATGGRTQVTALDVQAHVDIAKGRLNAWVETEIAAIVGTTDYSQSAILEGPYDVAATGGVGRLGIERGIFESAFEFGFASADDNPFDQKVRGFSFDREYRVGLLMFGEYLRKTTAVTAYNLADETYRAEPARGFDRTATGGAITGAIYINPRIAIEPVEGLRILAGYLTGSSRGDYTDPYQTGIAGGVSTGPNGVSGASDLGHELDLGIDYRFKVSRLTLRARAEVAWFSPGRVFASPGEGDPDDVLGGWLHAEASW